MNILWFGHSCFHITSMAGLSILTDPYDESVGYRMPKVKADVILVSHEHHDHNNVLAIFGNPAVVRGAGAHLAGSMQFRGVATYHDMQKGAFRGKNTVFCFQMDGMNICHLGDLGHILGRRELQEIGPVDIMFVPVGGIYTLDALGADRVINQLLPRVTIPMHYKTDLLSFELDGADKFLKGRLFQGPEKSLNINVDDLAGAEARVILLDYVSA